jgi:hypothetical protein
VVVWLGGRCVCNVCVFVCLYVCVNVDGLSQICHTLDTLSFFNAD